MNLTHFSEPISIGRTSITYSSPNDFNLSFKSKDKVTVLSKAADETSDDVWYVKINDKYGYAPKKFIVEEKVIVSSSKLIIVQNVTTGTLPSTVEIDKVQNTSESPPDVHNAEIVTNSSEAPVSNVQNKESAEPLKRSTDAPTLSSETVKVSESVNVKKSDEVKIEDLDKYDSKNFDEDSEGTEEDDEDDEDEYDDVENSLGSEEEIRKPVIEEPFVKKTAYVTTDSKAENTGSDGSAEVQPTLEIMAPTQSEIEHLKQQQELSNSSQGTDGSTTTAVNPSVDLESTTGTSNTQKTESASSEQPFTTTTIPVDVPQNPLEIPIETTSPLPDISKNGNTVDASKREQTKEASAPTSNVNDDSPSKETLEIDLKPDLVLTKTLKSEEPPKIDVEIPPFKPLPSVDNIPSDLNDSTIVVPNIAVPVVDQKMNVEVNEQLKQPSVVQDAEKSGTPSHDNIVNEVRDQVSNGQNPIVKEDEAVTTLPSQVVGEEVNNFEVSNERLPIEGGEATTENFTEQQNPDTVDLTDDSNETTTSAENEIVSPLVVPSSEENIPTADYLTHKVNEGVDNEIVPPLVIPSSEENTPNADYLTHKVNEGVDFTEPTVQSHNTEQHQQQVDNNNNLENESKEGESTEGFFSTLINSAKNLFGGSSTVESLVEDENFDQALNDILFAPAVSTSKENDNEGMFIFNVFVIR